MNIILLGAPGAGKGTQAEKLIKGLSLKQISTGDILREEVNAGTPLGNKIADIMNSGNLVSEEIVFEVVEKALGGDIKTANGFLFDGFPRNIKQAEFLKSKGLVVDHVVVIEVPDDTIVARLSGRRVHPGSGRVYHIEHNPPKTEGVDDETNEPLVQRKDDSPETVKDRLSIYHEATEPLVNWYKESGDTSNTKVHVVDGCQDVDVVYGSIINLLDRSNGGKV